MRNPEADARLRLAKAALAEIAERLEMPMENLLTPDHLRRVAWSPPPAPTADAIAASLTALGARRWQLEATAQTIADAFVEAEQTVQDATTSDS
jgi:ribonuclease D